MQALLIVSITFMIAATVFVHADFPPDMKAMMNDNVDPCDDFYEYTCGGWIASTTLKPNEHHRMSSTAKIEAKKNKILMKIVNKDYPLLGKFWDSCMAIDKMTALGSKPLRGDLNRIKNAKTKRKLLELAGELSRSGSNTFIKFIVGPDLDDARMNQLIVTRADMTLDESYYSEDNFPKIRNEYNTYINELISLSGFTISGDKPAGDIVIGIEQQLKISGIEQQLKKKRKRFKSHRMSIEDANIEWPMIFGAFSKGMGLEKTIIKEDYKIFFEHPSYMNLVEELIEDIFIQDLQVYMAFVMVQSRVEWLGEKFLTLLDQFFRVELKGLGIRQRSARKSFCFRSLNKYVPDLIGKYYHQEAFDSSKEQYALKMIELIKEAMGNHISNTTWMNEEDKNQAHTKLSKVTTLIGKSEVPRPIPSDFSRYYYAANVHSILSHSFDNNMKKVGKLVDRRIWSKSSAETNAAYTANKNRMMFPTAYMQPPLFNGSNVHPARNFGGIGTVMGHELTHGFDNKGRTYDGDGNKRQWWSERTVDEFERRAQCLVEQYSAFEVHGENGVVGMVNGVSTLNENIADSGGIALAWDAYRKYMKTNKNDVDVTSPEADQMFFIAFGQRKCSKSRDQYLRNRLANSPHPPGEWRINGVVMNNRDFAKVFNCKENSRMNPIKKCQIW